MNSFKTEFLKCFSIHPSTSWLLASCMEAKGKQDLWVRQKPEILKALLEQALIQSVESSNRIEGVTIEKNRLRPVLLEKSTPRDRSEEELLGYKRALSWIYKSFEKFKVEPSNILKLHKLCQSSSGDAGEYKKRDNEIIEILPSGLRTVRFKAVPAKQTPQMLEQLCLAYRDVNQNQTLPELLSIACYIFDFLCIHPFRDGNGRVSRLATALLLCQENFAVVRYISLERLIEESKEEYYQVLKKSSEGWYESKHDLLPWLNYFLSILRNAYKEFAERVETQTRAIGKTDLIEQTINEQSGEFTLSQIKAACPSVSEQLIRKVLTDLKKEKKIHLVGRGAGARWRKS